MDIKSVRIFVYPLLIDDDVMEVQMVVDAVGLEPQVLYHTIRNEDFSSNMDFMIQVAADAMKAHMKREAERASTKIPDGA